MDLSFFNECEVMHFEESGDEGPEENPILRAACEVVYEDWVEPRIIIGESGEARKNAHVATWSENQR